MAALVLVSVVCVCLGGLVGALRHVGPRVLGAIRTFALCAVLGVVALHLVPEALDHLGLTGGFLFAAGFGLPALAERFGPRSSAHSRSAELGFVGLVVHQLSDGLALWATGRGHVPSLDVALALFAHSTPLAALLFLRFEELKGRTAAFVRVAGLALASALGVGLGKSAAALAPDTWVPWTGALAAGLLLHLFAHDLTVDRPRSTGQRWLDFTAAALGVVLSVVGLDAHARVDEHTAELAHALSTSLSSLAIQTAPMLLLGLGLGAFVQTLRPRIAAGWIYGGSAFAQALRGAAIGVPLPVCACGVLPIGELLSARGAGAALVTAFLFATPGLGFDTLLLTGSLFGWPFAVTRLIGAASLSVLAGWVTARVTRHAGSTGTTGLSGEHGHGGVVHHFVHTFDDLVHHTGPWIAVGLLAAAYVQVVVPDAALSESRPGLDILIVSALAIPSYVCAASATPLGAVLLMKGVSAGAVFAGLVLGPVANVATLSFLSRAFGRKAAVFGVLTLFAGSWALASAVNAWLPRSALHVDLGFEHPSSPMTGALAVLLAGLLARSVWRTGMRAWLASLASTDHVHGHVRAVEPRKQGAISDRPELSEADCGT